MAKLLTNKYAIVTAIVLIYLTFTSLTSSEYDDVAEQLTLQYLNTHQSKYNNYSVNCEYKEVENKHWIYCESNPVKNAGLWQILENNGRFQALASNGKALIAMESFSSTETIKYTRNPDTSGISEALNAFN